jgi:ATP-binding cassette subfamily F protein uup
VNYLSVEQVSKSYGDRELFKNISFGLARGDKAALVARNGSGKTTLLNIITGREPADSGQAVFRKDIVWTYVDQQSKLEEHLSILENVISGQTPVLRAISQYEQALEEQEHNHSEAAAERLQAATDTMNRLEAWDLEQRIREILTKLQITDLNQSVGTLSGGQRKRVALAKALAQDPDLLILDEPTNHLDLAMIEWLEEYLEQKQLTLLLVTHDRYFLDRVCSHILELEDGQLYHHQGNYSYFIEKKAQRKASAEREWEKMENSYRRELEWVRRMPKARTTKSSSRVDAFSELEERMKGRKKDQEIALSVKVTRLGTKILELHKVKKSFGERLILQDFNYVFKRGEKVGIAGPNGAGKSTLLNLIMGLEQPDSGKIIIGDTLVFGYFSQHDPMFDLNMKVIDVVRDIADFIPMANGSKLTASQLLQQFGFEPSRQFDFVYKLSGGERRRLHLMTVLMRNPNFLILDEPTNDLDIDTLAVLEDFLLDFQGCLLMVSHDRFFMDKLADHVFVFEEPGHVRDFPGSYSDYRLWNKTETERKEVLKKSEVQATEPRKQAIRKLSYKEKTELEQLDTLIPELEQQKNALEARLMEGSLHFTELETISKQLEQLRHELDEKGMRWLELQELQ